MDFKKDMLNKYGIDLDIELTKLKITSDIFYERIDEYIKEEIKTVNSTSDLDNEVYEAIIYKAVLEQASYVIINGDITTAMGIDFQTGQMMALNEIRKREMSPNARRILKNAGLFYSGISYESENDYLFRRGY